MYMCQTIAWRIADCVRIHGFETLNAASIARPLLLVYMLGLRHYCSNAYALASLAQTDFSPGKPSAGPQ